MKVLSLCYDDFANYMFENHRALRSVGIQSHAFKIKKHPFGYPEEADLISLKEMVGLLDGYDVIQFFHSSVPTFRHLIPFLKKKKVVAYHTGTSYRQEPNELNEIFNPRVSMILTDQTEFMNLGGKRVQYVATSVDTDRLFPAGYEVENPIRVAHYPSRATTKGTEKIKQVFSEELSRFSSQVKWTIDDAKVPHSQQIQRMSDCDIYVELFAPEQSGKPYGCYGVTAFEAAALGKLVMTQCFQEEVYKEAYNTSFPMVLINNETKFRSELRELIFQGPEVIEFYKMNHRKWVTEYHSLKATGERLKGLLSTI